MELLTMRRLRAQKALHCQQKSQVIVAVRPGVGAAAPRQAAHGSGLHKSQDRLSQLLIENG